MTKREASLKAYKKFYDATQEAIKMRPELITHEIIADDGSSEKGLMVYDPSRDHIELTLNTTSYIQGKFIKGILSGLNCLMTENQGH